MPSPKHNPPLIAIIALLFIALAFLFYRDHQREKQIALLLATQAQQAGGASRSGQDPYLKHQVKNRIIKGYPEIQKCYQDYLTGTPGVKSGSLKMDWQIDTDGKVIDPEVVVSVFQNEPLHKCLAECIQNWKFPAPPVQKYVTHTFKFEQK